MRHLFLLLLALSFLSACSGPTRNDDDDSSGDDDDTSSDDDDAVGGEFVISDAEAFCGPDPEPLPADNLLLGFPGAGSISVLQFNYAEGCCPELAVALEVDLDSSVIAPSYSLTNDVCDCICMIEVGYTVSRIPEGTWTLELPNGVVREFTIE